MGTDCPNGHGFQPYVSHQTHNGEPAVKSTDVISHTLGCGCKVGGKKFMRYLQELQALRAKTEDQIQSIRENAAENAAAIWAKIGSTAKSEAAS